MSIGKLNERPVVASGDDKGVVLFNELTDGALIGNPIATGELPVQSLAWFDFPGNSHSRRDRPHILVATPDSVQYWVAITGQRVGPTIDQDDLTCATLARSGEDTILATGSANGVVKLWRLNDVHLLGEFWAGSDGTEIVRVVGLDGIQVERVGKVQILPHERVTQGPLGIPELQPRRVTAIAASSSTNREVTVVFTNDQGEVFSWRVGNRTEPVRQTEVHFEPTSLDIFEFGSQLAVACGGFDGSIHVINLATMRLASSTRSYGSFATRAISCIQHADLRSFGINLGDFSVLLAGSRDGRVYVCALNGQPVGAAWAGHTDEITSIQVGELEGWPVVVTGSADHSVRYWDFGQFAAPRDSTTAQEKFAARLEEIRRILLRPTKDVARELNVSTTTFWSWVHGRRLPTSDEQVRQLERSLLPPEHRFLEGELVALYRAALVERQEAKANRHEGTKESRSRAKDSSKDYDMFVSYSHRDRKLVEEFAVSLREVGVRLWYDQWEMRPGDVLRDRINDGIARARHFIVLVSKASLSSNWVKYELNSGMIDEIERGEVRVVPALGPGVKHDDLPADLRAKLYVDLRTPESRKESLASLVALVQPAARLRRESLDSLRRSSPDYESVRSRMSLVKHSSDQQLALAALAGLGKTPGSLAMQALAQIVVNNFWGLTRIDRAVTILGQRESEGGLLILTSSLLQDERLYNSKLQIIRNARAVRGTADLASLVEHLASEVDTARDGIPDVPKTVRLLAQASMDDIRYGIVLARLVPLPSWAEGVESPSDDAIAKATAYADERVPGLIDLVSSPLSVVSPDRPLRPDI